MVFGDAKKKNHGENIPARCTLKENTYTRLETTNTAMRLLLCIYSYERLKETYIQKTVKKNVYIVMAR